MDRKRAMVSGGSTAPADAGNGFAGAQLRARAGRDIVRRFPQSGPGESMAKTSQIHRDARRRALVTKYKAKRAELRGKLKDANVTVDEKIEVQKQLSKLPRNSCPTRLKNRCALTGRARGYYRKFGVSRIAVRDLAARGQLPGVRKSSW
jgi:small subunit ribosomal protein S14